MEKKNINVGGQAVIEGVMMKGPEKLATAVRTPDGEIVYKVTKLSKKGGKIRQWPLFRGAIMLFETMIQGSKELTFSANQADDSEEDISDKELYTSVIVALLLGTLLFMVAPSLIGGFLFPSNKINANLIEAVLRLVFFILYIWGISFSKDIKRVYEYHGAEHKVIYTYENNLELKPEVAKKYTTLHPRCGTSFLLLVMLISIITFSTLDFIIPTPETRLMKILVKIVLRIGFMPFIAGISYEFQRYTSKNLAKKWVQIISAPGLSLQKITTKEPDLKQLEVAIVALKVALGMEVEDAKEIFEEKEGKKEKV